MRLDNTISAIITGGASGLGEACARKFANLGVKVAILDMNAKRGAALASEINGLFVQTDVSDAQSVANALASSRKAHGQERICINCAGIATSSKTVDRDGYCHDAAAFTQTIQINLIGTFNVASQSAAGMATADTLDADGTRGVIINTASIAAFDGQMGQTAYAASKGGIAAMTLPMARDLARSGIRVMAIAPGLFQTPMLAGLPMEVQDSLAAQVPFPQRLGDPSEFAALAQHIVKNQLLNGEVIRLDGGIRMAPR